MKPKVFFEPYCTAKDRWFWRLRHRNGKIVADGSESYTTKNKLKNSMENVIRAIVNGEWETRESVPESKKAKDKWPSQAGSSRFGKAVPDSESL